MKTKAFLAQSIYGKAALGELLFCFIFTACISISSG
jgi:hypothetical protein